MPDMIECPECGGYGALECPECGTPNQETCENCNGTGEVEEDA